MHKDLKVLITKLEEVAKKNKEKFRYQINMEIDQRGRLGMIFKCHEVAYNKMIVSGIGETFEQIYHDVVGYLPMALKNHGYKHIQERY